jgi:hypothetical protein
MLNEVWKPIKYYEDSYMVSNYGRVKSIERTLYRPDGTVCGYIKEHYVSQHDNGRGYLFVNLYKNNKAKREYVHRLVALTFIDNPNNLPQVNHKDEDKQNNFVDNLEWCDCAYNNSYGTKIARTIETCRNNSFYERSSKRMKLNNPNKGQFTRGSNGYARKVSCDGKIFDCIKDCAEYYDVKYSTMRCWLSGVDKIPEHFVHKNLHYCN